MTTLYNTDVFKELYNLKKTDSILEEKCYFLAQEIIQKSTTICSIVENLGTLLVNPLIEKRELGTLILAEVLKILPKDFLSTAEVKFIFEFYCDRFKDNEQVITAVLIGILVLLKMENLPEQITHKVITGIQENIFCQQLQFSDRHQIYLIFQELLNRKPNEVKELGENFVNEIIRAMDGERDPRNLYLLFNWLPKLFQSIKLGNLTSEMFDVISCYFPVDFRGSPQNPDSITQESLAYALCSCLCTVPEFAEFCIPLILDKLDSSVKISKYDSLNVLIESCKTYDASIYEQYSQTIWNLLQKEILHSNDPDIENTALNAISAVINRLAQSESLILQQIIDNLFDTLRENLRPGFKLFLPTSKIFLAVARASEKSCKVVSLLIIDILKNQYYSSTVTHHKEILFRTIVEFAIAYIKVFSINDITTVEFIREIPELCLQIIENSETSLRIVGLESLMKLSKVLPFDIRNKVYEMLKKEIISKEPESFRTTLLKCFQTYAHLYKNEILQLIQSYKLDDNNLIVLNLYSETLKTIVSEKIFAEVILPYMLDLSTKDNLNISKIFLTCLSTLVEENENNNYIQEYLYFNCKVIDKLIGWILSNQMDYDLLINVTTIIKITIGFQTKEEQEKIIHLFYNKLLQSTKNDEKLIIILAGFLLRMHPEVDIPKKYELISILFHMTSTLEEKICLYCCMLIGNLINKAKEDEEFLEILTKIEIYIEESLQNSINDTHVRNIIKLISWVTKSLIIRGSDKSNYWTDKLLSLLDNYEEVGKTFKLIMDDSQDCLNNKSHCSSRLLYRQKFFAYVCKKLSTDYTDNKSNYLIALGYLLELAPLQIILLYFKEILRLIILCLERSQNSEALCAILSTLKNLIATNDSYIQDYIEEFLPRFLNLTIFENSMKVRIAALNCIEEIPNGYPIYKLLRYKSEIIYRLLPALDDKKRLVRNAAVRARLRWIQIDMDTL